MGFKFEVRLENRKAEDIQKSLLDRGLEIEAAVSAGQVKPEYGQLVEEILAGCNSMLSYPPEGCTSASVHATAQHRTHPLEGAGHLGSVSISINWWGTAPVTEVSSDEGDIEL